MLILCMTLTNVIFEKLTELTEGTILWVQRQRDPYQAFSTK